MSDLMPEIRGLIERIDPGINQKAMNYWSLMEKIKQIIDENEKLSQEICFYKRKSGEFCYCHCHKCDHCACAHRTL
jgi:hypothetical protein